MKFFGDRPDVRHNITASTLRNLWLLLFINAAGTWSSWLVLGPYVVSKDIQFLIYFGALALVRQLFGFLGVLFAESWPVTTKTEVLNRNLEWVLVMINGLALACVWVLPEANTFAWAAVWGLVRFFIGGISIIFGYRLIYELTNVIYGKEKKENATSSLVGQLAVGQGSVVIGSIMSFTLAHLTPRVSISAALVFDMASSVLFALWLGRIYLPKIEVTGAILRLGVRLKGSFTGLFTGLSSRHYLAFLLSLLSLTSIPTIFMYLSRSSGLQSLPQFYSIMNLINGVFLLIAAYQITKSTHWLFRERNLFAAGTCFLLAGCVLAILPPSLAPAGDLTVFITSASLSLGSTSALLAIHKIIMNQSRSEHAVALRASMALYLNLVFGFSELLCAALADQGLIEIWMLIKIIAGVVSAILIYSRSPYVLENKLA